MKVGSGASSNVRSDGMKLIVLAPKVTLGSSRIDANTVPAGGLIVVKVGTPTAENK